MSQFVRPMPTDNDDTKFVRDMEKIAAALSGRPEVDRIIITILLPLLLLILLLLLPI